MTFIFVVIVYKVDLFCFFFLFLSMIFTKIVLDMEDKICNFLTIEDTILSSRVWRITLYPQWLENYKWSPGPQVLFSSKIFTKIVLDMEDNIHNFLNFEDNFLSRI